MEIEFAPQQIKRMKKLWGDNPDKWLERIMVAASIVYEIPVPDEVVGRPNMHWLVWIHRDNPNDAHVGKRPNNWKDKKADYRIYTEYYTEEEARQALIEYLSSL